MTKRISPWTFFCFSDVYCYVNGVYKSVLSLIMYTEWVNCNL